MYQNYFKNHVYGIEIEENTPEGNGFLEKKFGKYIRPGLKVLEIGTGLGGFANFCLYKGVKDYTGIEVDEGVSKILGNHFSEYKILCIDAIKFLQESEEKYDVIFMSHVFEHFTIEDGIKLARLIFLRLNYTGTWINIMPNAGCISACLIRYSDITHKTIYADSSFNQVLLEVGFSKENIHHSNVRPNNFIKKIFIKLLGLILSIRYNTFELMTVVSQEQKNN